MRLSDSTWTDVRDADAKTAVVPVGSTEQHGPHAPLGTDSIAAEAVAEAAMREREEAVVLAPTIQLGVSEEHRAFDGTVWVRPETFRAVVADTFASLAHHGIDRAVVVNGHGGNVDALRELCARVSRDGDAYAVAYTWFDAVDFDDLGHAGPAETSLIRHLRPELIHEDRTEAAASGGADRWGEWVSGTNLAYDSDAFTDSGAVGDPREGGAELGEELLGEAVGALVELLTAVERRDR